MLFDEPGGIWDLITENDDFGETLNSRLAIFLEPGDYQLHVLPLYTGAEGAYTLNFAEGTGTVAENPSIAVMQDQIEYGSYPGVNGTGEIHVYPFVLTEAAQVEIVLRSAEFDASLELWQDNEEPSDHGPIIWDDDSGGYLNAKISLFLPAGSSFRLRICCAFG